MFKDYIVTAQDELAKLQNSLVYDKLEKLGYSIVDIEMKRVSLEVRLQRFGLTKSSTKVFLKKPGEEDKKLLSYFTEITTNGIKVSVNEDC